MAKSLVYASADPTAPPIAYSTMSNVRQFLRQHARPSTLSELAETMREGEADPRWIAMVEEVERELLGGDPLTACGAMVTTIIGCPDGREICRACFDSGADEAPIDY